MKPTVAIALSGGIDSGIAAAILKKRGYRCLGVHLKLWHDNQKIPSSELKTARKIAARLQIPFYVIDLTKVYRKKVVDYFLDEYKICRTPNPCVKCNKHIKFGLLLKKAKKLGADFLATGHYVRIKKIGHQYHLYQGKDQTKDQSYFLYTLTQNKLKHLLFPIGRYFKTEIRELAVKFGLPELNKIAESQGVCFLTQNSSRDFLKKQLKKKKGPIKTGTGQIIGTHEGLFLYTIGQRRGIRLGGETEPWYVKKLDFKNNTLIVGKKHEIFQDKLNVKDLTFTSGKIPKLPLKIAAKIRYRSPAQPAELFQQKTHFFVKFRKPQKAVTPGQAVVFYRGKEMLGGGTIKE